MPFLTYSGLASRFYEASNSLESKRLGDISETDFLRSELLIFSASRGTVLIGDSDYSGRESPYAVDSAAFFADRDFAIILYLIVGRLCCFYPSFNPMKYLISRLLTLWIVLYH